MATATLDGHAFPFDPNSVTWGYQLNISATDTLGGRVIQVLSAKISTMSWQAEAGSRDKLLAIYERVLGIMLKQAETERPVRLVVPSKGWVLDVYVSQMPRMGWDLTEVTFKYTLSLEVDEDFGRVVTSAVISMELDRLADGVGYDPNWHGGRVGVVDYGTPYSTADSATPSAPAASDNPPTPVKGPS